MGDISETLAARLLARMTAVEGRVSQLEIGAVRDLEGLVLALDGRVESLERILFGAPQEVARGRTSENRR